MNYSFENNTFLFFFFFYFFLPSSPPFKIDNDNEDTRRLNFEKNFVIRYEIENFATNEWSRNCTSFFDRGVSIEMEIRRE